MVAPWRDERGKGRLGCLFALFLVAICIYIGKDFAGVYFRYYQISDAVKGQAAFAAVLSDSAIRNNLVIQADSLNLPLGPRAWEIKRTRAPNEITISASYVDTVVVDLPGFHKVYRFRLTPKASAGL